MVLISEIWDKGLLLGVKPLDLRLPRPDSGLRGEWYSSVGVGAILLGVSGKSLSMKLSAAGIDKSIFLFFVLKTPPFVVGKNPEVCSIAIVSPRERR